MPGGTIVHTGPQISTRTGYLSTTTRPARASLGVDHLPHRADLAPHLVVLMELAGDLVVGVEHGRVIAPAQLGADAQQADVGLLSDQEHRDLARHHDGSVALRG